ncbi:MAG: response regulator transcription factor [Sulfurospirillaceae bacterium]|nr:response regulator transcription factor [Sulfurospirillaceae bacterium]
MNEKMKEILESTKVLLVEDDISLKEMIKDLISPYVPIVHSAKDGEEGLEKFNLYDIDLIISDIHMARMSGIHMVKEIRKFDPNIPVIFLTAYDTDENMLNAILLKSKNFLKKPFDKNQLLVAMVMAIAKDISNENMLTLPQGFQYCLDSKKLYHKTMEVELTRTEQRLLFLLLIHRNHTVSFEMIEAYTWQEKGATPDTIRNYINKLRKKIYPEIIKNIQGIGYQLTL